MKRYISFILLAIGLTSCSSTYFYTFMHTTDERVVQNENQDFVIENNNLWLSYSFNGESAPMQITIFNKGNDPIAVDWSKSALIINNIAYNYEGKRLQGNIESPIKTQDYNYPQLFDNEWYTKPSTNLSKQISYIPPNSMISHIPIKFENLNFDSINKKEYSKEEFGDKKENTVVVKRKKFTREDSPLSFHSYLTILDSQNQATVYDQEFYISSIIKTKDMTPNDMPDTYKNRGDMFYIEKPANNTFWNVLGGTAIMVGITVVNIALEINYQ